jgi:hypothetical protein
VSYLICGGPEQLRLLRGDHLHVKPPSKQLKYRVLF